MATLAMTLPLLPGKTESWNRWVQEMAGTRLSALGPTKLRIELQRERKEQTILS